MTRTAIKGNLAFTPKRTGFEVRPRHYLLVADDRIVGLSATLPDDFQDATILDFGDCLVVPGLVDLHVHAAQYGFRGLGMDMELLPWLETYAFPEEAKFGDAVYATRIYRQFAEDLADSATTRAIVWGTIHAHTEVLFTEMYRCGLGGWIGKVNMDRHAPPALTEDTNQSATDTRAFIQRLAGRYPQLQPVITPRFIPSCSDNLLLQLGLLSRDYHIPVTSHLSENHGEIAWVRDLMPQSRTYAEAYDQFGLFGSPEPCVMAHGVHPEASDYALLTQRQVTIAHCPNSNLNVLSGLAPIRHYLTAGVAVGLGTDVAGGFSLSIFDAMVDAIRVSKMYQLYIDPAAAPLTVSEAFYLGTRGGGQVFGPVGSFEPGWLADIAVFDDRGIGGGNHFTLSQRLERLVYLHREASLTAKFLAGQPVGRPAGLTGAR